ncbi:hypothetical protein [Emticicia fontis]
MKFHTATHSITYTNSVDYANPIYWELYQNNQLIKSCLAVQGGFYNNIRQFNYNNHPDSSIMDLPTGVDYTYKLKFWNLGKTGLPCLFILFRGDSSNTNNMLGMVDFHAYTVYGGEYKEITFQMENYSPYGYYKFNCNSGWVMPETDIDPHNRDFTLVTPPPGVSLSDVTGTTVPNAIVNILSHRLKNNQLEWYKLATGVASGAVLPNVTPLAGVTNPYYIAPSSPETNLAYYYFNSADYFNPNQNPAPRSPITFCYGLPAVAVATMKTQQLRRHSTESLRLASPPNLDPSVYVNSEDGFLFVKMGAVGQSLALVFVNPLNSRAGVRVRVKKATYTNNCRLTIKSSDAAINQVTNITAATEYTSDYLSAAPCAEVYVYLEQTAATGDGLAGLSFSVEFLCNNIGDIVEPTLYQETGKLLLGKNAVAPKLMESFVSTVDYANLTTIPETAWQPTDIVPIPATGTYYVFVRFTLNNGEKYTFRARTF